MLSCVTTAVLLSIVLATSAGADESRALVAARGAAEWLRSMAVRTEQGTVWRSDASGAGAATNLYAGGAGVVLFFLEMHRVTGEASYLADAQAGADFLVASLETEARDAPRGLYTGTAGVAFALNETGIITGEQRYEAAAERCVDRIVADAREVGAGVAWNESTDVISGSAGIGLFLLDAAERFDHAAAREAAIRAGWRLLEVGETVGNGLSWRMTRTDPRRMPNFSHGTAGVAYFLLALYETTDDDAFLDAATKGAERLLELAANGKDRCLIGHHEPGGEQLFYLGWCHGPVGTSRLFARLHRATGDDRYREWIDRSAASIRTSGIPESSPDGFWENVSVCCGSAGVAAYFLERSLQTDSGVDREFADRMLGDVLDRAVVEDGRWRWPQAEHRVRPDLVVAQTGYMQGAAGIGAMLLRFEDVARDRDDWIRLPDDSRE